MCFAALKLESVGVQYENDVLMNTDANYTDGSRISLMYSADYFFDSLSVALGREMYTPFALSTREVIENDRPYGALGYFALGIHNIENERKDSLYVSLGGVGSKMGAEKYQGWFHKLSSATKPEGWSNQIEEGLVYQINLQQQFNVKTKKMDIGYIDVIPSWSINVGNGLQKAKGGIKIGLRSLGMGENFYMESVKDGYDGVTSIKKNNYGVEGFIFGNINGVNRNIFLDGSSDGLSHSVEKLPIVYDFGFGVVSKVDNWVVGFMNTWQSPEHKYNDDDVSYNASTINNERINNKTIHAWSSIYVGYSF